MKIQSILRKINIYYKISTGQLESNKVNVLFIVHPNSILEQHQSIKHVEPFLNKIKNAIDSFDGLIIVTDLGRAKYEISTSNQDMIKGVDFVKSFMEELKENPKVKYITDGSTSEDLGMGAMKEHLDDLFIKDKIGDIIVGGCFDCKHAKMCVRDTYNNLVDQYGSDKVSIDASITAQAGRVILE